MGTLIGDLKFLAENPAEVNVVGSETFHKRVCNVFDEISNILQKSAGPCGAPTVISNMPSYHITKDGYTIAKNIMYDNYKGYLDQVITYMITDICERLNNVVGDGTTAAILCTNKMYQQFSDPSTMVAVNRAFFLPRDIIYRMQNLKNRIINRLMASAQNIKDLPRDEMVQAIRDVVYISSNGNDATADMIADAYDAIGSPAIRVEKAKDGITKCTITEGFEIKAQLTEKLYINTDAGFLNIDDVTVMMFDHKVDMDVFESIILPTVQELRVSKPGKRLLVLAPSYDTVALRNIAPSLNAELAATGTITLVMTVYPNATIDTRRTADDFAMLIDTNVITEAKVMEMKLAQREMIEWKKQAKSTDGTKSIQEITRDVFYRTAKFILGTEVDDREYSPWVKVGHVDHAKIGLESSVFSGFHYNENRYNANLRDAEKNYADACKQYRITGDFNFDVDDCLNRLNRLRLKTAVIYVGSDTEFSLQFDKDAMDDAVRAAQSAYFNGTVLGKHVSILKAIFQVRAEENIDDKDELLLNIFFRGFSGVNMAIMENAFVNEVLGINYITSNIDLDDRVVYLKDRDIKIVFPNKEVFDDILADFDAPTFLYNTIQNRPIDDPDVFEKYDGKHTLYELILNYELDTQTVLDLNVKTIEEKGQKVDILTFSDAVVNSAATDREILTASIDLIGLLLTSNQLIVAKPNT